MCICLCMCVFVYFFMFVLKGVPVCLCMCLLVWHGMVRYGMVFFDFLPEEGLRRGLLCDFKTWHNLREHSFQALLTSLHPAVSCCR